MDCATAGAAQLARQPLIERTGTSFIISDAYEMQWVIWLSQWAIRINDESLALSAQAEPRSNLSSYPRQIAVLPSVCQGLLSALYEFPER
jgi:hypothetical protein